MHGPMDVEQDTVRTSPNIVTYTMCKGRQIMRNMFKRLFFIIIKSVR